MKLLFIVFCFFIVKITEGQILNFDEDFYSLFYLHPEEIQTTLHAKGFSLVNQQKNSPSKKISTFTFQNGGEGILVSYWDSIHYKAATVIYFTRKKSVFDSLKESYKKKHTRLDTRIEDNCTVFWGYCYKLYEASDWLNSKFQIVG